MASLVLLLGMEKQPRWCLVLLVLLPVEPHMEVPLSSSQLLLLLLPFPLEPHKEVPLSISQLLLLLLLLLPLEPNIKVPLSSSRLLPLLLLLPLEPHMEVLLSSSQLLGCSVRLPRLVVSKSGSPEEEKTRCNGHLHSCSLRPGTARCSSASKW